jgi:hypothetical protein
VTPLAEGVWTATDRIVYLGMRLDAKMTVLRLPGGDLLIHSPVAMTPERRAAVNALGPVAHLYAPNTFHHTWIGAWAAAYPSARLHAPAALAKKRRDLRVARTHGAAPERAFAEAVDELLIGGFRLDESVLVHRPSRTLVVADLVHNVGRPDHGWTAFYARAMGFYDRIALSRMIRWTGFTDRRAARRSIDALMEHPFERLVVGHGEPIVEGARDALAAAYAWLASSSP